MRTAAQDDADYGEGAHLSVSVSLHLSARTTAEVRTYPDEGRATIGLTGHHHTPAVTVFGHVDELRELRDLLTDTLAALTTDATGQDGTDQAA
jgi:hypothetical protein